MREGSLDAPTRHPLGWRDPEFYDADALDAELRRVFDICHGCRRCFNLCDSFPRLFDLIDESPSGELDTVESKDFAPVVDACTLCDMCFMVKCPYVPPHEFNLDFPHLMLRARAVDRKQGGKGVVSGLLRDQMSKTDRNGRVGCAVNGIANWACKRGNKLTRPAMQATLGVHTDSELPPFADAPLTARGRTPVVAPNPSAPAWPRKAVIYATCYANYNDPAIADAAMAVLALNGVTCEIAYPECCGMPQLEGGEIEAVAGKAKRIAARLETWIDQDYDVIALVPSCSLMLKSEWPLIAPDDPLVAKLARATFDISEYIVKLANDVGLVPGMEPLDGPVSVHIACHARAQNMGRKGGDMLKLIPEIDLHVVERCAGHGGTWGCMEENFETAMKLGKSAFRQLNNIGKARYVASECPLAGLHIAQGMETMHGIHAEDGGDGPETVSHPVILLARAYGL